MSTLLTGELFDQAVPLMRTRPGLPQLPGVAITDFTFRSVTGTNPEASTAAPGSTWCAGCRYAVFIQKPSNSWSRTSMCRSHFTQESPAQREAVLVRQGLAIHLVGQQGIGIERLLHGDGPLKFRHGSEWRIRSIQK